MKQSLLFFLSLVLILHGCSKKGKQIDPRKAVLALVNEEIVTVGDLLALMPDESQKDENTTEKTTASEMEALKRGLLDQLIERKILLQEARRLNLALTQAEIINQLNLLRNGVDEKHFFQNLADQNIQRSDWEKKTHENLLIEKLLNQLAHENDKNALLISEEMLRTYYEKNQEQWHVGERLKLRQIILESEEEANTLRQSILNGADFSETGSSTHALKTLIKEGAQLGYVTREEVPIEFDPLFEAEVGSVSKAIKTPFGYHLVLIEDKRGEEVLSFEEIKETLQQTLLERRREEVFSEWIEKLRLRTEVRINEELFKTFP